MTFDEWWSEYCGNDTDKSLQLGKVYAASAWDRQQKRIAELEADVKFLLSWAPKDCPKSIVTINLDPTVYFTLTYEGDKKLQERVDKIRAALLEGEE